MNSYFLVRVAGLDGVRYALLSNGNDCVHLSAQEPKGHATSVTSHKPNRIKEFHDLPFLYLHNNIVGTNCKDDIDT